MMRRAPLWLTLVPLLAGLALYGWAWRGWADDFAATVQRWFPGATVSVTGFPYRMETELASPRLASDGPLRLTASAASARLNRGPWRPELTIFQSRQPRFEARLTDALGVVVTAPGALTSLRLADGRLERLSTEAKDARIRLGFTALPLAAASLETHARERAGKAVPGSSPRLPPRGQLMIAATGLRIGDGAPLTLDADMIATGPERLTGYDRWAGTGTVEISRLTLADATGEIAAITATLTPQGRTTLRLAGTISSVCPATVASLLNGTQAPSEQRLRAPVRFAVEGALGEGGLLRLSGLPGDLASRPRRGQQPACLRLR